MAFTVKCTIISCTIVFILVGDQVSLANARSQRSRKAQEHELIEKQGNLFIPIDVGGHEQKIKETSESLKREIRSSLEENGPMLMLTRITRQITRSSLPNPTVFSGLDENTSKQADGGAPAPVILPVPVTSLSNGTDSLLKFTNETTKVLPEGLKLPEGLPSMPSIPLLPRGLPNISLFQLANLGKLQLPETYNNLNIPKLDLYKTKGIGKENDSYGAVPVRVYMNIRSVRHIDEEDEMLTLDLELRIEWVDGSLFDPRVSEATDKEGDVLLNQGFMDKVWRPDIYFDETVKVTTASLMNKPSRFKYNPHTGSFSYSTRSTVQLSCDMMYKYYPADTQECEFTLRSFLYFSKDLDLNWFAEGVYLQDPANPNFDIQVKSTGQVKLPQTLKDNDMTNDTFDGITFTILARRKLSFHVVQTYLPSIFFIVITWLAFLVPSRMAEARVGISMTTLLTLTAMFASVRESTPIVSYVKAIDIWMVFCIFFVFMTLLEFTVLMWLRYKRERAEEWNKLDMKRKTQDELVTEKDLNPAFTRSPSMESTNLRKYEQFAEYMEKNAVVTYSIVFIVFNVIYWNWLLIASNYSSWSINSTLNGELDN